MKRYTASELQAIRKLSEVFNEDQSTVEETVEEQPVEESDEDLGFSADDFFSALQASEEPVEKQIENSYIQRAHTGRGLLKLHGKTTPTRIFW